MAQYQTGSVTTTNGSSVVLGLGTKWSEEVRPGDLLTTHGLNLWYEISSVVSDTEITLTEPFMGGDLAGVSYAITRDFTPTFSLPMPAQRDIELASLLRRCIMQVEQALISVGALTSPAKVPEGGTGTQSFTNHSVLLGSGVGPLRSMTIPAGGLMMGTDADPTTINIGPSGNVLISNGVTFAWGVVPAPKSIGGISNDGGDIAIGQGGAITVTSDNPTKTITISETHSSRADNPHAVTATQVGLGSVLNAVQLVKANNLSDLTDKTAARGNLDLGSMSTQNANGVTITGGTATLSSLSTDIINEGTAGYGVSIDGVLLKDGGATFSSDVTITGDFTVHGNITWDSGDFTNVQTESLSIKDNIITLADGQTSGSPIADVGIEAPRGASTSIQFLWVEADDCWKPRFSDGSKAYFGGVAAPIYGYHVGDRDFNDGRYLRQSNNLSDLSDKTAALTTLGGATSAALSAHADDTNNPHSVTAAQVGAITGVSDGTNDLSNDGGKITVAGTGRISTAGAGTTLTISTTAEANYLTALGATGANVASIVGVKSGEALGVKRLRLNLGTGATGSLIETDGNYVDLNISGVPNGSTQMISPTDTAPGYAVDKILGGTGVTVTKLNAGANETLSINMNTPGASEIGGVKAKAAVTGQFIVSINTDGTVTTAQVQASDVQGLGTAATLSAGINVGDLVQVQSGGKLPPLDGSNLTNLPSSGGGVGATIAMASFCGAF